MTSRPRTLRLWAPRVLGLLVALFVGAFALDAVDEGFLALLVHAAPAVLLLVIVAASWRWEWLGGVAFVTLAVLYGVLVWPRWDWFLIISGPMLVVGMLFLWSWRRHRQPLTQT